MEYFTIVHIIFLLFYIVLFIALAVLTLKETRPKIFWAMIFANVLVTVTLSFFTMLVLDKYTKKARIENLTQKRVLRNETISFKGKIRNIGKFTISRCVLEVKLVNNPTTSRKLGGSDLFKPSSGLDFMSKNPKPSTVSKKFLIATSLKAKELRNFSVNMPFPPYFSKASTHQYLRCR